MKRKRDVKEPLPSTTKTTKPKELSGKDIKSAVKDEKVSKDQPTKSLKDPLTKVQEANKDLKTKRPKEVKLLQDIPASPLVMQTRKRSPLPRSKNEQPLKKGVRPSDSEFKPSTSTEKTRKTAKTEGARATVKRTLSTSQSDEKGRKSRKVEKSDEKLKEPGNKVSKGFLVEIDLFNGF